MKVFAVLISLASVISTVASAPVVPRQYAGDTFNQLTDGTPCRNVTVIYGRGTGQQGNVGDPAAVGPLFFNALASRIGEENLAVQGITYAANILGFLFGGDGPGSRSMANHVKHAAAICPDTKIVLSGYSQGAQIVHKAAGLLSQADADRVTAVLTFGDPFSKRTVAKIPADKVKVICHEGDRICDGGIIITPEHTNYQEDADDAAAWVASMVA
ncbi:cutinase [Sodiomyces alkalinus F11]|uniref:Cutinase n=1 Tax=Sodiomyces alkalinus (strain CBS 110278 / VKM F-3762 / F11) TaxID=1314773 RepID=A0A3N2Q233_SODAK|nr:cutinase [Sodiomyces alkalinus F11]ROT40814.1 cutinase [Sodiomyces alkalinus F11]